MICALLIFRTPRLPAPLTGLSPWVDMRLRPIDDLRAELDQQRHRRFLKTHTPLDGLPAAPGVTYLVIGRDPRDVAVSMDHHRAHLDDHRIRALLGESTETPAAPPTVDQRRRILRWINDERPPTVNLDSLRSVVAHLDQAWSRRHDPAVVLLHRPAGVLPIRSTGSVAHDPHRRGRPELLHAARPHRVTRASSVARTRGTRLAVR
ncbi:sulfotransferase domain-containing protein [Cryptosporangium sp. NPDC051539]|uniref:sulfotransferase domain-containing protein n=1 Tax=Cryptosporangium sp. NPDC051539 TaxID=3363962 RepID=UPI0037A59FAB